MRKLIALIAFGTLLAAPLTAGESKGQTVVEEVSDEVRDTLTHLEIRTAMVNSFGTDALGIDVGVENDIVVLEGEVAERSTQELAEQVAMSIDGISEVHNRLQLPSSESDTVGEALTQVELETRDAYLETKVKGELTSNIGDESFDLEVEACDGVVSVRGELPDDERRDIALRTVENLSGVDRVIDLIDVTS